MPGSVRTLLFAAPLLGSGCAPAGATLPPNLTEHGHALPLRPAGRDRTLVGPYDVRIARVVDTRPNGGLVVTGPDQQRREFDVVVAREGTPAASARCVAEYSWQIVDANREPVNRTASFACTSGADRLAMKNEGDQPFVGDVRAGGRDLRIASTKPAGRGSSRPTAYVVSDERDAGVAAVDLDGSRVLLADDRASALVALIGGTLFFSAAPPEPRPASAAPMTEPALPPPGTKPAAPPPTTKAAAPPSASALAAPYRDAAGRIEKAALASDGAHQRLSYLADRIGARLSGTPELERAVRWAQGAFERDGHENVALEPVRVPRWVRGAESAELVVGGARRPLPVLALGGSVGTPREGITAEVVSVASFEELERLGDGVRGKIVLFDHPMSAEGNAAMAYGEALPYRITGAERASRFGARAVLVRSLTTRSLGTLHTGAMRYGDAAKKIPAASVTVEDAALITRLVRQGEAVKVRMTLGAATLPDADSANVVAELRGREKPDEIVVIGAHIDSWDVGQGAQDDGAGCVIVMEALATLRRLGLTPRRTIRAVLYTNEENGGRGAIAYATAHAGELARHVAAFESDIGAGTPLGFMTDGPQPFAGELRELASLLAPVGAALIVPGYPGEDVKKLEPAGVPLFGLLMDPSRYFDIHHSAADTLEKIDPENLRKAVAALATLSYVVADRERTFRAPAPAPAPKP